MSYRAIYAYAWDVADVGVSNFVAEAKALGLNTVTFAGSYHAGKFLGRKARPGRSISRKTAPLISASMRNATARSSRSKTAS